MAKNAKYKGGKFAAKKKNGERGRALPGDHPDAKRLENFTCVICHNAGNTPIHRFVDNARSRKLSVAQPDEKHSKSVL